MVVNNMANEFICSDCRGDGIRCQCHKKRPHHYIPYQKTHEEIIIDNERELSNYMRILRDPKELDWYLKTHK